MLKEGVRLEFRPEFAKQSAGKDQTANEPQPWDFTSGMPENECNRIKWPNSRPIRYSHARLPKPVAQPFPTQIEAIY